ncbi:MAG: KAP family P-loop NTPase fold protein [Myxococcaceae bacterium]
MWPDNETRVDLLGFDFLVDELLELLLDPNVLPMTVGVAGDWGSGKSSILKMAAERLREAHADSILVVEFSPWRFEDYADVKAALLADVLGKVRGSIEKIEDPDRRGKLFRILKRLALRVKLLPLARLAATGILKAHGVDDPALLALASDPLLTSDLEAMQERALQEAHEGEKESDEPVTLAAFRESFEELVDGLDVQGVVVLVDDLDRCLPDTIINVFEAMRLFLYAPKTAFVVAADQRIVQAAVEHAYPEAVKADSSVSTDYLEKVLQFTISIPPLSTSESETYTNLLMAEAHTTGEDFAKLVAAAQLERAKGSLAVAMNHGIAAATLGDLSEDLAGALAIAGRIAPALAPKQRGNPRQIKRFLNLFELRRRAAARRGLTLDPAVLAKIMVLETVAQDAHRILFGWQAESAGKPVELERAEKGEAAGDATEGKAAAWMAAPGVGDWLRTEPPLAGVDLRPYFFFSRDRLSPALPASRLSPELQALLTELRSDAEGTRTAAVASASELDADNFAVVYSRLLDLSARSGSTLSREFRSALDIAAQNASAHEPFRDMLVALPPRSVARSTPMVLKVAFGSDLEHPVVKGAFDVWVLEPTLKTAVELARRPARGKR